MPEKLSGNPKIRHLSFYYITLDALQAYFNCDTQTMISQINTNKYIKSFKQTKTTIKNLSK